ncbi:MAG: XkdX family protein [Ruminococcaceae bacterium]|nr:XkdX family protein [Oscillospiraceae bacterium]
MAFWSLAFTRKWVTIDQLRQAVKTDSIPYGQITPEQFQTITGADFQTT